MNNQDLQKRIDAAYKLLIRPEITPDDFQLVTDLLKGLNPKVDSYLQACTQLFGQLQKLQEADIIHLALESLPETTPEEKKRKKLLLLFLDKWRSLREEVIRVSNELQSGKEKINTRQEKFSKFGRIFSQAKGPLGIITLAAVAIVTAGSYFLINAENYLPAGDVNPGGNAESTQLIIYQGKYIPLTETVVGKGPECDNSDHYHAKNHTAVKALNGTIIKDPGGCGFGKVSEVKYSEIVP